MRLAYTVNEKDVLALKCQFSSAGQSLIQPLLEPFEHNLNQKRPTHQMPIPAHASTHFNP